MADPGPHLNVPRLARRALFGWVVYAAGLRLGSVVGPRLEALEAESSP